MRKVLRRAAHSLECYGGWGWSIGELLFLYIQLSGEWKYLSFILLYVSVSMGMAELHLARELSWEEVMGKRHQDTGALSNVEESACSS